jgi:hypothetical protein
MSRIPFVAAVVGALLIGGATTGGTHASWVRSAPLSSTSVASGSMGYTATNPAGVTVTKVAGSVADTSITVHDTSVGKNLKQRITASITGKPSGVTATVSTSCGSGNVYVDSTPGAADQTFCVRVTSSTTAVDGNVTVSLSSAQMPSPGWTTAAITRSVAVTVNQPVNPGTPSLACAAARSGNDWSVSWSTISGETYMAEISTTSATAGFGAPFSVTSPYLVTMGANNTTKWLRVKAFVGPTGSSYSNVVRVTQGTGASSMTCGAP